MKKASLYSLLPIVILAILPSTTYSEVRIPQVLGSNMVLQRNAEIKVWGWADPKEKVTVHFADATESVRTASDGTWIIELPPMKAGGPFTMKIRGKNIIELDNILIGDVWICSGQSNMEWPVSQCNNPEEESQNAYYNGIRLLTVAHNVQLSPTDDIPETEWMECTPGNVLPFSAVGYYFGREIHKEVKVPVGLISTNWGGTNIETWTSLESISTVSDFDEKINLLTEEDLDEEAYRRKPNSLPTLLYNGMIHPLLNLTITGAIWYQGEANARRAYQYRTLLPLMIEDWRMKWDQPEFPFLIVQLANFKQAKEEPMESDWAELREAQQMALALPATGLATAIDIGEADDIHPGNKQDVGRRLALSALKIAYGHDIVHSGPTFRAMKLDGKHAVISFDNVGSGLKCKDKYGYVKGFAIAGEDRVFHWAKASLKDNHVLVWSDKVNNPIAVRYAWADNPDDVNLYNKEGLPALPFRTDNWPGITANKK